MEVLTYKEAYDKDNDLFGKELSSTYLDSSRYHAYNISDIIKSYGKCTIFIIDSFNMGYAYHFSKFYNTMHHVKKEKAIPIGVVMGMASLMKKIRVSGAVNPIIIFSYDTGKKEKKNIDSTYKANRVPGKGPKKDFIDNAIRYSVLHLSSIKNVFCLSANDTEADDLVNDLSHSLAYGDLATSSMVDKVYIISKDQDLHWNICDKTKIYRGTSFSFDTGDYFIDSDRVDAKFGVPPALLPLRKVLLGKASDGWGAIVGKRDGLTFINRYRDHKLLLENGSKFILRPEVEIDINNAFPRVDRTLLSNRLNVIRSGMEVKNKFLFATRPPTEDAPLKPSPFNLIFDRTSQYHYER